MSLRELVPWRTHAPISSRLGNGPLASLQRDVDALMSEFLRSNGGSPDAEASAYLPPMNVSENAEAIRVTAELPGMDLKDVQVRLENGDLVISGKKETEREEKGRNWQRCERSCGEFRRVIGLPDGIDEARISATISRGVLSVDVPKTREAISKSRSIEVKSV